MPPPIIPLLWGAWAVVDPSVAGLIIYDVFDPKQVIPVLVALAIYSARTEGVIMEGQVQMAVALEAI
jgi:hypothetical protein